jgi:hypothetical protein
VAGLTGALYGHHTESEAVKAELAEAQAQMRKAAAEGAAGAAGTLQACSGEGCWLAVLVGQQKDTTCVDVYVCVSALSLSLESELRRVKAELAEAREEAHSKAASEKELERTLQRLQLRWGGGGRGPVNIEVGMEVLRACWRYLVCCVQGAAERGRGACGGGGEGRLGGREARPQGSVLAQSIGPLCFAHRGE